LAFFYHEAVKPALGICQFHGNAEIAGYENAGQEISEKLTGTLRR